MVGLLSVAALLFVAGELDFNANVVAEERVGQAVLEAGQAPHVGVASILTPGVEMELRRPNSDLRVTYALRLFWGNPRMRPLVLHVANLLGASRLTRRVNLLGGVSASEGEADFSALSALLPSAGMVPTVVKILSVSAMAGVQMAVTRVWELGATAEVGHRRQLGTPPAMGVVLPEQTIFQLAPAAVAHLSLRDDLLLMGGVTYQTYSSTALAPDGTRFLIFTPEVGWRTHLTPQWDLRLVAGISYLRSNFEAAPGQPAPDPVSPVGNAEIVGRVFRDRGIAMQVTVAAAVDYYADPILAVAVPRGLASARALLLLGGDWSLALEGTFGTSLRSSPIQLPPPTPVANRPDETFASISLPVRHRVSNHVVVEFGGRWFDRGPHLDAPNFAFHQRQAWAYVMLTATTRRPNDGHLPEAAGLYSSHRTQVPVTPLATAGVHQSAPGFPQNVLSGQGADATQGTPPVAPIDAATPLLPSDDGHAGPQDNPGARQTTPTGDPGAAPLTPPPGGP